MPESSHHYPELIKSLLDPGCYPHRVESIELRETHISWVILAGDFAYKIKKPVNLEFLDFSTLQRRKKYCEEEIRLNKRLAPELYIEVTAITGSEKQPQWQGDAEVIEYAVKMCRFDDNALLDNLIRDGLIKNYYIDVYAKDLADFHSLADVATQESGYSSIESLRQRLQQNFTACAACAESLALEQSMQKLRSWSKQSLQHLATVFSWRKEQGFVRECHGDLHLGNLALINDRIVAFDCLEFNAELRWIDVISEVAFLYMDLEYHGRSDLANRFLNGYLENSGDYAGLKVLRHYLVYRAMVRAKVACIQYTQDRNLTAPMESFQQHIKLAQNYARLPGSTPLLITHGLSGSGKSYFAGRLLETKPIIRLRSDVERKRLLGLEPNARSDDAAKTRLYSAETSAATYDRLADLAADIITAGFPVIVDATFLKPAQRTVFRDLAQKLNVPFLILEFTASRQTLEERIRQRMQNGKDASEADLTVLAEQQSTIKPLNIEERSKTISIDTTRPMGIPQIWSSIEEKTGVQIDGFGDDWGNND